MSVNANCGRCGKDFHRAPEDAETLYCPACVKQFKAEQAEGLTKEQSCGGFADGKFIRAKSPRSFYVRGFECCGVCGSKELSGQEYGHTYFGVGTYRACESCGAILDFFPDASS